MYKINTLGEFDILYEDTSLLESGGNPNRTMRLFKYFLANRDRKVLPENIIEDLWYDNDFVEPKNVLRTQISRLRKMFYDGKNKRHFFTIENKSGYYIFKILDNCFLDIEEFEKLINQGIFLSYNEVDNGMELLEKGIKLYKGDFLGELEEDEWIIPIRNRMNRLYLKGLYTYIEILKERNMNREIVNICESTIEHDPYGESLHIYFIEALLKIGQKRYALSHYEYITSRMYNNLGITPSLKMKQLYKKLQSYDGDIKKPIDIGGLDEELEEGGNKAGALICEPFYFKFLYNLERRKRSGEGQKNIFLGLITLEDRGSIALTDSEFEGIMSILMEIVEENLRRSDVLSKWNDKQIVSLHYDLQEKDLNIIVKRLEERLKERVPNKNIELLIRFKPI